MSQFPYFPFNLLRDPLHQMIASFAKFRNLFYSETVSSGLGQLEKGEARQWKKRWNTVKRLPVPGMVMINSWCSVRPPPADNPVPKFTPSTPSNFSCLFRSCAWRSFAPANAKREKKTSHYSFPLAPRPPPAPPPSPPPPPRVFLRQLSPDFVCRERAVCRRSNSWITR